MKWITKALPDADTAHCCVAITANEQLQEPRIFFTLDLLSVVIQCNGEVFTSKADVLKSSATLQQQSLHHSNISVVANYISVCLLELTSENGSYAQETY